jgi:hypothetical protein
VLRLGRGDPVEDHGRVPVGERRVQVVRELLLLRHRREGGLLLLGPRALGRGHAAATAVAGGEAHPHAAAGTHAVTRSHAAAAAPSRAGVGRGNRRLAERADTGDSGRRHGQATEPERARGDQDGRPARRCLHGSSFIDSFLV